MPGPLSAFSLRGHSHPELLISFESALGFFFEQSLLCLSVCDYFGSLNKRPRTWKHWAQTLATCNDGSLCIAQVSLQFLGSRDRASPASPSGAAGTSYRGCRCAGWAVLVGVSIVAIKHCDQKQLEQERVYFPYTSTSQSITQGSWGRNLEARLMQKPWRNAACWLGPAVWAYHLAYTGLSTHCAVGSGGVYHPLGR